MNRGNSETRVCVKGQEGLQSNRCFLEPTRDRLERRMSNWVSLQHWQMYDSGTLVLRILAQDRWIQVLQWLHSIMARPAKGFMQKHVTRSHESSSAENARGGALVTATATASQMDYHGYSIKSIPSIKKIFLKKLYTHVRYVFLGF